MGKGWDKVSPSRWSRHNPPPPSEKPLAHHIGSRRGRRGRLTVIPAVADIDRHIAAAEADLAELRILRDVAARLDRPEADAPALSERQEVARG